MRTLGDSDGAAEIVQDVWVRAAQKLADFRWASQLSTWLAGIAINCCRERLRQRQPARQNDAVIELARAPDAHPRDRVDLERAIAQLPDGYREVLLLHDVEGYTHEEIGRALDIEPGSSRSQLTRARAAIRERLEPRKDYRDANAR